MDGMKMNYKTELIKLFTAIPPEWNKIKKILNERQLTKVELAEIAYEALDKCCYEYQDAINKLGSENVIAKDLHAYYILDSLKLLLDYGLDPNICIGTDNIMWDAQYVDFPDVGAAALRLLLEHGGNPNLVIPDPEGTFYRGWEHSLLEFADLYVLEDAYDYGLDFSVQCWMILAAYGKTFRDGTPAITMLNGHSIDILKKFEQFDYTVKYVDNRYIDLRIINKETGEEVAEY